MPLSVLASKLDLLGDSVYACVLGGEHNLKHHGTGFRYLYHTRIMRQGNDMEGYGLTFLRENRDKLGHDMATGK